MDYFELICSILLRVIWFYGGYIIFFRKVTYSPFTDTRWGARVFGTALMATVLIDSYHKWFTN